MKDLINIQLQYDSDVAETIQKIQEFTYRCQSFFYNRKMTKERKMEFMSRWLNSIFNDREAQFFFSEEVWLPNDPSSIANIVRLDAGTKNAKLRGAFYALIDFREEEVGVIRFARNNQPLDKINIFNVTYKYIRPKD